MIIKTLHIKYGWESKLFKFHFRFIYFMTTMKTEQILGSTKRGEQMGKIIAIANQKGGVGVRP